MDKISGIVPASKRVASVDLKNAMPVRPGTPTFGRPVGISTLSEANKPTTAELAMARQKELAEKRAGKDVDAIQDMADRFFMQRTSPANANEEMISTQPMNPVPVQEAPISIESLSREELETTPPGTYLDVVA